LASGFEGTFLPGEKIMSFLVSSSLEHLRNSPSRTNGHSPARAPSILVPFVIADPRADEIAMISHELRNSLGVVRNAARLLRQPLGTNSVEGARVLIERHVAQMTQHINDLLEASRRDVQKKVLHKAHVDLRTIVEFATNAIASDLARRTHRLVIHVPDKPVWIEADVSRLEQVFSNLLINAAKYTPDGGEIVVTIDRADTFASIRIRDSGIGIEPAVLLRVFDMFAQADAAAPCSEGGSGIGLAVVRDLVEMHGGSVRASSAGLGQGSEFTVLLPMPWAELGVLELVSAPG
jgi:signal transduction histidine kinase